VYCGVTVKILIERYNACEFIKFSVAFFWRGGGLQIKAKFKKVPKDAMSTNLEITTLKASKAKKSE
jgi:hypothetical protein